ncbi:MAG: M2 family metallopeptidase [Steroidobacteraceae bacterium]
MYGKRHPTRSLPLALLAGGLAALAGCAPQAPAPTSAEATAFAAKLNSDMAALGRESSAAGWVQATYINEDTQLLSARANERYLEYYSKAMAEAKRFEGVAMDAPTARTIEMLKRSTSAPAPDDAAKRGELATIMARMEAQYGEGKYCTTKDGKETCQNIDQLSATIAKSRDYAALTEAWTGWHSVGAQMRGDYTRFVELANEGAKELGYADLGAMWRSRYDMGATDFEKEVERLWAQVKPLYDDLHCYARTQLAGKYGEDKVPAGKPIPAQLLGNLWAQQWNNIYDDVLKPYPAVSPPNLDAELARQHYDAKRMTQQAESFYTSLGMPKLPETFWERSMLTRPRDREVVCHASAWHMDAKEDVRIKQCIVPTKEELDTIYHEMGHVYYFLAYKDQPYLFEDSAHDGFHEAIGDTVVLSMTPGYMSQVGLGRKIPPSHEAVINEQMKMAADKIAFLPFGLLVDQWRWQVFSGKVAPADYNKAWWQLRERYQGVAPPVARSEADFDPGAKYHVPGNTPYTRYFLSFIVQFQFHKALCEAAGYKGPLNECSVFGSKEAGQKFWAMLQAGASQPWPDTLAKLTGTRQMDGSAILEYFAPLQAWLKQKNAGQQCGWTT